MSDKARVLIIDDEELPRMGTEAQLLLAGHDVRTADSGLAGIAAAREFKPDVIVLDVMMPEMDGFETCRRLRADPATRRTPVLLLTALSDREYLEQGVEAGADDFLTKPALGIILRARVRSMVRIKRNYEALVAMQATHERWTRMIAHDMRSPLTSMRLIAQFHATDAGAGEEMRQDMAELDQSTRRLERLVTQMLLSARLREGRVALERETVPASDVVAEVLGLHRRQARERGLQLCAGAVTDAEALIDTDLVSRALDNLVANAIKASPRGGRVAIDAHERDGWLCFEVCDEGPGVPEALRETLFEEHTTGGQGGFGLGLALCRLVADLHGGTVGVQPAEGGGSVFTLSLPTALASTAAAA